MNMDLQQIILRISIGAPGFLMAIVFHEAAHAYMAYRFGDQTAKYSGRLTLNPSAHIDPIGTVLFPLIGAFFGGVMFGWAKPVPIDPRKFKNIRKGIFWVSFAGPLANILLAGILSFILAFLYARVSPQTYFYQSVVDMIQSAIGINIVLAAFNLIPFPPLDGSKMVSSFLSYNDAIWFEGLARYSIIFLLIIWMTPVLQYIISPALYMGDFMIQNFYKILL
jgi:Zn-dependent protease